MKCLLEKVSGNYDSSKFTYLYRYPLFFYHIIYHYINQFGIIIFKRRIYIYICTFLKFIFYFNIRLDYYLLWRETYRTKILLFRLSFRYFLLRIRFPSLAKSQYNNIKRVYFHWWPDVATRKTSCINEWWLPRRYLSSFRSFRKYSFFLLAFFKFLVHQIKNYRVIHFF